MAEKPPTAEEFEAWLHPSDVIEYYHQQRELHPRSLASGMLADGLLRAAARQLILNGRDHGLALIPKDTWLLAGESEVWSEGNFRFTHVGAKGIISINAYDVRIDPDIQTLPTPEKVVAPPPSASPPKEKAPKGGRRPRLNGEPITRVVKRLLVLPASELASYKVEVLATELAAEYEVSGIRPPHYDNIKKDASGILRVLREGGAT